MSGKSIERWLAGDLEGYRSSASRLKHRNSAFQGRNHAGVICRDLHPTIAALPQQCLNFVHLVEVQACLVNGEASARRWIFGKSGSIAAHA